MTTGLHTDAAAIKREHCLADVLTASGLNLVPAGTTTFRARCPFHDDRSPSLFVDGRDQHFHCFGCGAHGDVIDFVMRRDLVDFAEACQRLAATPAQTRAASEPVRPVQRERRWDRRTLAEQVVMNTACALYRRALWREPRALAYLRARAIPDWVIRQCALGFADGYSLETYFRRHSGLQVAQDVGLLRRPERVGDARPLREFFADRIVVPEVRGGQCLWFIGRRLDDDQSRPKYLAMAGERPVLGFERAAGHRDVFLCEGILDYLTAVSWNLPAFTPGGTHLPAERLGFLARARVVYGVLDGDEAGRAAAERFGAQLGHRWRPIQLPDGCDLNDLGRQPGGRAEFFRLLAAARRSTREEGSDGN